MQVETQDCNAIVNIGGVDYLAREHTYSASVLKIADTFSITIPAPNGKARGVDGSQVPIREVATMGAPVKLSLADPRVNGGAPVDKLLGVVTGRQMKADPSSGTVLAVTGADLGWHLSSCGKPWVNTIGLSWQKFLSKICGLTVGNFDPSVGGYPRITDSFGWGFKGLRGTNLINRKLRHGRSLAEQVKANQSEGGVLSGTGIKPLPRMQIEVGQTIDSLAIQFAKLDHLLVNVSTDGFIQIWQPDYAQEARYHFFHYPAGDPRGSQNNVISPSVNETADSLYTKTMCFSTVMDSKNTIKLADIPNAGGYYGQFEASTLPFYRLYTFSDTEQMSQTRVNQRAQWQWQRGVFDSWEYTFETVGHSQGGVPFVEDTMASLTDEVYGYSGMFYVSAVEATRKLARPGFDKSAGTRCKITLKLPNMLAA